MPAYVIGANGFRRLRKDLKQMDDKAPKQLAKVNKSIAQHVVELAKAKASSLGGVANKAAPALSASGSGSSVAVFLKKTTRPYAFGAEFGSKKYKQFKPWRGNNSSDAFEGGPGYFLFPTIRANKSEIEQKWLEAVNKLLETIQSQY
ncbi:type III secretion system FlhB-like substrate exporter [Saccharothrix ecbatanensis]|uniref:Type III secretion system FlhB-like substrate exporter n=1 Tax=Saccharothrix ecbatanensis TaxID=1105145 RepID=A0A7W9M255_9PSEU|nr:hypothetical protein [Saccharothrix ecbatanensis]MBB5804655.1 type III secretion system FlhB-like substrate exporter [Saccharothrix ecbatanensis]